MKALCWYGKEDVRVETVADPGIVNPKDAIVRVSRTAICGSDLHLYDGYIPTMQRGDILGHEFMGEIVETGRDVRRVSVGDRVVVPFAISCGRCEYCRRELWSLCDNTNPNAALAKAGYGDTGAGIFGYSHLLGGYAGGQAEYVRVPFADVGCLKIESDINDEKVLFLSDILPTAYQAVEQCQPRKGQVLAIWGLGPVGQLAVTCGKLFDFDQIIAIDDVPERLEMARENGATVINMREEKILETLDDLTAGRGPDACIDAVGMEAHGTGVTNAYDRAKQSLRLQTDRPTALREAIFACRKGGVVSAPGVYGGFIDKMPFGAAFAKGLTFKMGQTHMHRYMKPLLDLVTRGELNPTFLITHRMRLSDAPRGYKEFRDKQDGCIKVVLQP